MSLFDRIKQSMDRHSLSDKAIRLAYGPETLQYGDLYLPAGSGPHPTIILIHGGYWRARYGLDLMTSLAEDLAVRGFAAWNIEYRRVGNPGGGWPGTFLDVARATDYLQVIESSYTLDLQRVVPIGHSAGGHLAFWLAARPRIPEGNPLSETSINEGDAQNGPLIPRGAISLAGVLDLMMAWRLHLSMDAVVELLGGTPNEVPERYTSASPAALLPLGIPQVLVHGTEDPNVPLEVSLSYAEAAKAAHDDVTLIEMPGIDHFEVINPRSAAWATTVEGLQKLLKGA
jgi:acetyl esterase/lipase